MTDIEIEAPEGITEKEAADAVTRASEIANGMFAKEILVARRYYEETSDGLLTDPLFILLLANHKLHGTPYKELDTKTLTELMEGMK